ncbi:hypothetical protein WJX84_004555 [Apatococcus fuscideae]|uniref:60S ribosomal protein L28 n=1 Tax=Apatococcus fuscideae TaxID=2026836 RepID=A0AAW1TGJ0_9CHLO
MQDGISETLFPETYEHEHKKTLIDGQPVVGMRSKDQGICFRPGKVTVMYLNAKHVKRGTDAPRVPGRPTLVASALFVKATAITHAEDILRSGKCKNIHGGDLYEKVLRVILATSRKKVTAKRRKTAIARGRKAAALHWHNTACAPS